MKKIILFLTILFPAYIMAQHCPWCGVVVLVADIQSERHSQTIPIWFARNQYILFCSDKIAKDNYWLRVTDPDGKKKRRLLQNNRNSNKKERFLSFMYQLQ